LLLFWLNRSPVIRRKKQLVSNIFSGARGNIEEKLGFIELETNADAFKERIYS
jgi:hypothetical protein